MSKLLPPEPGHGYKPRDWRGRGAWKEVYRAVSQRAGEWRDVALLRYLKQPEMKDVLKEIQFAYDMMIKPPIPEHVARLYHFFMGDDGHVYLVQELMYRPLDKLAPLSAAERYLRIARDLSTGLRELHERTLVHRDLKLDNCGVDYNDRAKLFDLGLVTSEDAPNLGTLLTLAPELCVDSARHFSKEADIWALGATLFALRSGEYPFVTPTELARRRDLNADSPAD